MRRVLGAGMASLAFLSSCGVNVKPNVKPVVVPKKQDINLKNTKKENVKSAPLVLKSDSLSPIPHYEVSVIFNGGTLKDFCDYLGSLGYACRCDKALEMRPVLPKNGVFRLDRLIEKVSREVGGYASYDGGVIRFSLTKVVVYQVPLLSSEYKRVLFEDENSKVFNKIRQDFFEDFKKQVEPLLKGLAFEGEKKEKVTYHREEKRVQDIVKKNKNNTDLKEHSSRSKEKQKKVQTLKNKSSTAFESNDSKNKDVKGVELSSDNTERKKRGSSSPSIKPYSDKKEKKEAEHKKEKTLNTARNSDVRSDSKKTEEKEVEKKVKKVLENSLKNGIKYSSVTEGEVTIKKAIENKEVAVIPEEGIVVAVVNREQEKVLDSFFNKVKSQLNSMVAFKVYVVELSAKDIRQLETSLNLLKRAYRKEFGLSVDGSTAQINFTSLSTNYLDGIATGVGVTSLVNFIKNKLNAKVISSAELLSLSREIARLKDAVSYPYLQPEDISVGGTNPTLSYQIKYVNDGIDLILIPTVVGDRIYVQVSFKQSQYLGDKTISAGNLGNIQVPIKAPKVINTSFACRSGDVVFVGGLKVYKSEKHSGSNLIFSNSSGEDKEYKEVIVFMQPKLIKFSQ